jgi:hypothetical protein
MRIVLYDHVCHVRSVYAHFFPRSKTAPSLNFLMPSFRPSKKLFRVPLVFYFNLLCMGPTMFHLTCHDYCYSIQIHGSPSIVSIAFMALLRSNRKYARGIGGKRLFEGNSRYTKKYPLNCVGFRQGNE